MFLMGLNALISVDFRENSSKLQNDFENEMLQKEWSKIEEVKDTWVTNFNDGVEREKALQVIQQDINSIIKELKLKTISLAVQLSEADIVYGEFTAE